MAARKWVWSSRRGFSYFTIGLRAVVALYAGAYTLTRAHIALYSHAGGGGGDDGARCTDGARAFIIDRDGNHGRFFEKPRFFFIEIFYDNIARLSAGFETQVSRLLFYRIGVSPSPPLPR